MKKQLVGFYLKRHMFGIAGLAVAIGFGVGGYMMMGKAKDATDKAETDFEAATGRRSNLEKGQTLGDSTGVRVDDKNADAANDEAEAHRKFVKAAAGVIRQDIIPPMTSGEFMVHMANVVEEMNQLAREAMVQVQRDRTNTSIRIPYNFTFMNLRSVPQLSKDKIPELQLQLQDIRTISSVLFQSGVRSIESLQRTRVTSEDFLAGASRDFLDTRSKYTNNIAVVRPYKVRFQCLSGEISKALNGFASEKNFFVIRKMEVTQLGAKAPATGGLGGGVGMGGLPGMGSAPSAGGFPGGGGSPPPGGGSPPSGGGSPPLGAGGALGSEGGESGGGPGGESGGLQGVSAASAKPKKALTPPQMAWLVKQGFATKKATNVISESLLEVEMDLDVIRKKPGEGEDLEEEVDPASPIPPPATNAPAAATNTNNTVSGNPVTKAPQTP